MSYKVQAILDNRIILDRRMEHLPRSGDVMRLGEKTYVEVVEVVWCMDEDDDRNTQHVNLRVVLMMGEVL